MKLTQERLKHCLDYDPETGVFTWANPTVNSVKRGDIAGRLNTAGHRQIMVDTVRYVSAKLAVLWMTGTMPPAEVDHKNMVKSDDRWDNLRLASHSQNMANKSACRTNKLGVKGVHRTGRGKYHAQLCINGQKIHLGDHDTVEMAHAAYVDAARMYHGEFARG